MSTAPTFNPSLSVASDKAGRPLTSCADCGKDKPHAGLGLCSACYQRAWKAGTLPAKVRREGERRDCQCKQAQHQHGTKLAYVVDRCRCRACLDANNDYERDCRQRKILARWNPGMPDTMTDLVDAQPARDHLRNLTAAGMGLKTIVAKYNLGHGSISAILYGRYPNNPGHPDHRPPRRRITRDLEQRILAARLDHADQASIDGTGTRRRLQALIATGWSQKRLAHQLGWDYANFNSLVHGHHDQVHAATAKAVADLYDQLWNTPPTAANRFEAAGITRARNVAQQHGWAPPMAFPDDEMDNPDPKVDEMAREAAGLVRLTRWDSLEDRLWGRVDKTGDCWVWIGPLDYKGYGRRIGYQGRHISPHRLSYELSRGAIPDGLVLDHLCRNRACVNPDHLEPVTAEENTRRGVDARWSEPCPNGHSPEHRRAIPSGKNICAECQREADRRRDERSREKRRAAARERYAKRADTRAWGSTVEDIEYLADADETPEAIAARLGTRWDHLATTLRRNGRQDLLDRLNRRRAAA